MNVKIAQAKVALTYSHFSYRSHNVPVQWAKSLGMEGFLRPPNPSPSQHQLFTFIIIISRFINSEEPQGTPHRWDWLILPPCSFVTWCTQLTLFAFQFFQQTPSDFLTIWVGTWDSHWFVIYFCSFTEVLFNSQIHVKKTSQMVMPYLNVWSYSQYRLFISPWKENTFLVMNPSLPYKPEQLSAVSFKFLLASEENPF